MYKAIENYISQFKEIPTENIQKTFEYVADNSLIRIGYEKKYITVDVSKVIAGVNADNDKLNNQINKIINDVNCHWKNGYFKTDSCNGNSLLHIVNNFLAEQLSEAKLDNVLTISQSSLECIGSKIMFELYRKECEDA